MNMLKRGICLLALMLPAAGLAEDYVTLAQLREQSAAGWHQTYEAMGREVVVDADVLFRPERETCPIVTVESMVADLDDSLFDMYEDMMMDKECGVYRFPGSFTVQMINWRTVYPQGLAERNKGRYICEREECLNGEIPKTHPENVDLTCEAFLDRVNQELTRFLGLTLDDFFIDSLTAHQPLSDLKVVDGKEVRGKSRDKMGSWGMVAMQRVHGMPILMGFSDVIDGVPEGKLIYGYCNPAYFYFTFACSRVVDVRTEDVPLLSFDAFKAKMETYIAEGKLRGLEKMEFGMVVCKDGDEWVLTPAWRINGSFTENPKKERVANYQYDFNAQTGERMNTLVRNDNNPPKLHKILTWDDVK